MKASYRKYILDFKVPGGTSRGILTQKETWFLVLKDRSKSGIGECAIFRGLSADDCPEYEDKLKWVCANIQLGPAKLLSALTDFPSIQFGIEQAFLSLQSEDPFILIDSDFTKKKAGIEINGLIWMGTEAYMQEQIGKKIEQGFSCLKLKIGALDFSQEIKLLAAIRKQYSSDEITIRVDANGAFKTDEALDKLKILAQYDLHSIEQPIKAGNIDDMKELCGLTPLPIALDEELIGVFDVTSKEKVLQTIRPQYIILKPSLVGGFAGCRDWINLAAKFDIDWWVTSALESNIGLNAIAQWTYSLGNKLPQGLGTGSLFDNNFESPLNVADGTLFYNSAASWQDNLIEQLCI
ncbi:o-succinylbenzoate synthase [Muriicola sp. Z0-33]|uniref:o-succinylbenzoate synthase n=1 Tax=Muriicola sp. Z0-33 TaxID=2816957 RepID=UPI0022388866|nr:o-succinylbenzoate synthase [Muriicola sp. Z0-33]MCW5516608.1 o-succinylbenzoate synthase [Muriicola sp. Z0-33]